MERNIKTETHRMQPSGDWVSGPCSGLRAAKSVGGSARKRIAERDYLTMDKSGADQTADQRQRERRGHAVLYKRKRV